MVTFDFAVPPYPREFFQLKTYPKKRKILGLHQCHVPVLYNKASHPKVAKVTCIDHDKSKTAALADTTYQCIIGWEVNYFPYKKQEEDEIYTKLPSGVKFITAVLT
eukprot:11380075-Ditylum_brightwellii.AAC.2